MDRFSFLLNLTITIIVLCGTLVFADVDKVAIAPEPSSFQDVEKYWAGAAEISRYELRQERYGQIRKGDAVMIFTREPFLKDRHVKDERGSGNFQVLKLNSTRQFLTGVYPYNTMVSVFQPLTEETVGQALKVTTSVQEWCGQVFMQSNRRGASTKTIVHSYFEQEDGGVFENPSEVILEDEIWTAIRLNPQTLPIGEMKMVPGSLYTRFAHVDPTPETARAKWVAGGSADTITYQINYPNSRRILKIEIRKVQPYTIESWSEGRQGGLLTTAKLTNRLSNFAYWQHNNPAGEKLRSKLGLK